MSHADVPLAVFTAAWDIVHHNGLWAAISGDPALRHGVDRNVVWRHFTDDFTGVGYDDRHHEEFGEDLVADLRAAHARYPDDPVPKAAIISAVPPLMVKTEGNPGGLPKSVFDDLQAQLAANRAQFYQDIPAGPFYGYNRPGAQPSEGIVRNWWRQGMMGGAKAHYDGIVAFSQTDFSDDLKRIDIPVLVMHGDDDQIVPYENSGVLSAKLLRNGTLKTYPGFPHGMPTTQAEVINADLLAFIRG